MTTRRHPVPSVFTIPAGVPFLDTLVEAIADGRLVSGFPGSGGALAWSDLTLYLPTRRAARAARQAFVDRAGGAALLPKIRPLGDLDEADLPDDPAAGMAAGLKPAISPLRRRLLLTRLVLQWSRAAAAAGLADPAPADGEAAIPASPADAAHLAADLAVLVDQMASEDGAWGDLDAAISGDHADHWRLTGDFLKIIRDAWPAIKNELAVMDPGERRDALLRRQARWLADCGSPAPVIAAGSTGTSPATLDLLMAIARLENGALVVPGLDQHMDAGAWTAIGGAREDGAGRQAGTTDAAAGHPQYGLKRLLDTLRIGREEVIPLAQAPPERVARARLLSDALRPSQAVPIAMPARADGEDAAARLAGIGLIEAAGEREEACAIALVLRQAVETPGRTAALITPDRALARRVSVELRRWRIDIDDSAGRPLMQTRPAVRADLLARIGFGAPDAHDLLALCRTGLAIPGVPPGQWARAVAALERIAFRGPPLPAAPTAMADRLADRSRQFGPDVERGAGAGPPRSHPPQALVGLDAADWDLAARLVSTLDAVLAPMVAAAQDGGATPFARLLGGHLEAISRLDAAESGDGAHDSEDRSPDSEARRAFDEAMARMDAEAAAAPDIAPAHYPDLFRTLLSDIVVRTARPRDTRVHIWGTLEARLQHADVAVLGGLNETVWPAQTRLDPFLSRGMRAALALQPLERRIGLAAHDFVQAMGHREVWLTRATRRGNAPQVESRWLQRFTAAIGTAGRETISGRGARFLAWTRAIDRPEGPVRPAERPQPAPPVELRPRRLSVTEIERLIRDPYAIHARHVLGLRPFEPLAAAPDLRDRGTLVHDILGDFVAACPAGPYDKAAFDRLMAIGKARFARFADEPLVQVFWWPRFVAMARWFLEEEDRRPDVVGRHAECAGVLEWPSGFRLSARADRLDRLDDGGLAVVDYKTGTPPSNSQVVSLLAPQLPLEAVIAVAGGFDGIEPAPVTRLQYYKLGSRARDCRIIGVGTADANPARGTDAVTLNDTIAGAKDRLAGLISAYDDPRQAYVSQRIPDPARRGSGDYDHLARIDEWSVEGPD